MGKLGKTLIKIFLCIIGAIFTIIFVFWIFWRYEMDVKKTVCDTSVSPDGKYELTLMAIGEAGFPFGSASGRLILEEGGNKISEADFELRNDGAGINSSCWKVTWNEGYAEVILSGEEQFDEQVTLYFDGTIDHRQLTENILIQEQNFIKRDLVSYSGKEEIGNIIPEWVTESEVKVGQMCTFYLILFVLFPKV